MIPTSDNQQKYENYKIQFQRLAKALANDFNLEAMFIEYAIMEDRTESILRHAGLWEAYVKHIKNRMPTIDTKIRYIEKCAEDKKSMLHRYFEDDLLQDVLEWKEKRNRMIHALLKQKFETGEIKSLAEQGNEMVKKLRTRVGNYNRMLERQRKVERQDEVRN